MYKILILCMCISSSVFGEEIQWKQIGSGHGDQVVNINIIDNIIYAGIDIGGIYKSIDKGESWQAINKGFNAYNIKTRVIHTSGDTFLVGGRGGLYKSTDRGNNWVAKWNGIGSPQPSTVSLNVGGLAVDPKDSKHLLMGQGKRDDNPRYGSFKGDIYESKDEGETWKIISNLGIGATDVHIQDIQFDLTDSARIYIATPKGLFISKDAGKTWNKILDISTKAIAINPEKSNIIYVSVVSKGVYRSEDRGETWNPINKGLIVGENSNYNTMCISKKNPDIIYLCNQSFGGGGKGVWKTIDGGNNWNMVLNENGAPNTWLEIPGGPNDIVIDPDNDDVVYLAASRAILKTIDSGKSWRGVVSKEVSPGKWTHTGICIYGHTRCVGVDPKNSDILFIGNSDHGAVKSIDGGKSWYNVTWDPVTGNKKMPNGGWVNDIIINPVDNNIVYALNQDPHTKKGGVVKSIDGGETWKQALNVDTTGSGASAIVFNPINSKQIYACWEKGLYFSNDEGNNWVDLTPKLKEAGVLAKVIVHPVKTNTIYVGGKNGLYISVGSSKVIRGGSWNNIAIGCRSAERSYYSPNSCDVLVGFRCVQAVK
ncbi:MAG: hypothetical protein AABY84_03585 [Candidatus Firestonebacteria bacterium]